MRTKDERMTLIELLSNNKLEKSYTLHDYLKCIMCGIEFDCQYNLDKHNEIVHIK